MPDYSPRSNTDRSRREHRTLGPRRSLRAFDQLEARVLLSFGPFDSPMPVLPPPFFARPLVEADPGPPHEFGPDLGPPPKFGPDLGPPPELQFDAAPAFMVIDAHQHGPRGDFDLPLMTGRPRMPFDTDFASRAIQLAEKGRIEVAGRLAPGQLSAVYAVPVRPEDSSINLKFRVPLNSGPTGSSRVVVYQADGLVVGDFAMPMPGNDLVVHLRATGIGLLAPSSLFLGIARDSTNADSIALPGPIATIKFTIEIDRDNLPSTGRDSQGSLRGTNSDGGTLAQQRWSTAPGTGDDGGSPGDWPGEPTDPRGLGQELHAPIPQRSTGANALSTPLVGPLEGAVVDLALVDLSPDVAPTSIVIESSEPTSPIVSPDGFPMFGSSRPFSTSTGPDPIGSLGLVTAPPRDRAEEQPDPTLDVNSDRPAIVVGLGVLAGVTAGLLVPDVVATFTPQVERRPLPWEGRSRRSWRPFFGTNGALGA